MGKAINRRRVYRLLLQPRFQVKYGAYFTTIAVSSLLCSFMMTVFFSMKILTFTQQRPQAEDVFTILMEFAKHNPLPILGGFVIAAFFYFTLALTFTKRIAGPIKSLVRHVDELKSGNYDHKTTLRKDDDLQPLMTALNDLSDSLKSRHVGESKIKSAS